VRIIRSLPLLSLCVALGACHHATIETGLEPSLHTIHEPWANSWIAGLVPPSTVETGEKCPSGVSKVETQRTFLNGLVGILTLGIYTPMEIKVTCAAESAADMPDQADVSIGEGASLAEVQLAFMQAADRAVEERRPVYVEF
jgi:hypothetical protein